MRDFLYFHSRLTQKMNVFGRVPHPCRALCDRVGKLIVRNICSTSLFATLAFRNLMPRFTLSS